jgi:hypothetical protein
MVALDIECCHVRVGHFDASGIEIFIELAADGQARGRCRGADEFDDGAVVCQRSAAPVSGDEREKAVLDLVPLAGAGRQMKDGDGQSL